MATLLLNTSHLLTMSGGSGRMGKRGAALSSVEQRERGAMLFDEHVLWVGDVGEAEAAAAGLGVRVEAVVDAGGRVVMPGFVDPHTHIVFAGSRAHEFAARLRGATYLEIAAGGGGILSTMRAVRGASAEEMAELAAPRILKAMRHGTTTMEIKSGYGLSLDAELEQLRAVKILGAQLPVRLVPTFLGAHDFPPEYAGNRDAYVDIVVNEMIPAVAEENLAEYCDVFTDEGYYTVEQSERILNAAVDAGLKVRVHADEFVCLDAAVMAARLGAHSADHLLQISDAGIEALSQVPTVATLLPGTAFFLRLPYAPARSLVERGVAVALATDCNPGSSNCVSMQMMIWLATMQMRMTVEEALNAATINAAVALGREAVVGSLEVGKKADFLILDVATPAEIAYEYGVNHVEQTWIGGKKAM